MLLLAFLLSCATRVSIANTVTYNANAAASGTVPRDGNTYSQGAEVTVLGNAGYLAMTGYALAGWNTSADGLGTSYAAGATFTMGSTSVALYAVWIPDNLRFAGSGTSITITGYTTAPSGSLAIPGGVTGIGDGAFSNCSGLTSVTIPLGVTSIGWQAFGNCRRLTSVTIPSSVASITGSPFVLCTSLTGIPVDPANQYYKSVSGVLFDKTATTLVQFPSGVAGGYTIPSGVTDIGHGAFDYCSRLSTVTIPSSVTSIVEGAFSNCFSLTSITVDTANQNYTSISGVLFNKNETTIVQVPAGIAGSSYAIAPSVTRIGDFALGGCSGLTSVTIPSSVTNIGFAAFYGSGLTSVTIPSSVANIGSSAFGGCSGLTQATIQATTPPALPSGSHAFSGSAVGLQIHVPSGALAAYQAATGWSDYASQIVSP
jgi:hypothetical protein